MKNFNEVNKNTYNSLAEEYTNKWKKYIKNQSKIIKPFEEQLKKQFKKDIKILDIGCGVGINCFVLSKNNFKIVGIDFSEKMIEFAKINSPKTKFINKYFLKWKTNEQFQGIIATSFIPLFPKAILPKIIEKMSSLLVKKGFGFITFSITNEKGYVSKKEFENKNKRYRNGLTKEELIKEISKKFKIIQIIEQNKKETMKIVNEDKEWVLILIQKP